MHRTVHEVMAAAFEWWDKEKVNQPGWFLHCVEPQTELFLCGLVASKEMFAVGYHVDDFMRVAQDGWNTTEWSEWSARRSVPPICLACYQKAPIVLLHETDT